MSGKLLLRTDGLRAGVLSPPPSKSDAHRALVLEAIAGVRIALPTDQPLPNDIRVLQRGLAVVRGTAEGDEVDCEDAGAPFRFLLTLAALRPGRTFRFTGTKRLAERPRRALLDALSAALGPSGFRCEDGWPLVLTGARPAAPPTFTVDASESGQFVSSVLLGAAAVARDLGSATVVAAGRIASAGYVELTLDWLRRAGFVVDAAPNRWSLRPGPPPPAPLRVPGDWSSIGYLLPIAWRAGGTVASVELEALHPDRAIVGILEANGARFTATADGGVRPTGTWLSGGHLEASGAQCPDLLPTLAAIACATRSTATFHDVEILRAKESDRLAGIQRLVDEVGGAWTLEGSALRITPPVRLPERFHFDPSGDHRMAMSAALLATLRGLELKLTDPDCVAKSFPGFWDQLFRVGVSAEARD